MTAALVVSELSARSPDMGEREFAEFVEDIRTNGQLVPIWVRGDEVIDGRKRLAACERLGIAPKTINVDPTQNVERIARALNVLRTHYSASQRAIFAAERATLVKGNVAAQVSKFGDQKVTIRQAADEAGVSPSAVSKARQIASTAAPEVTQAMKRGDLTIHAAGLIAESVPVSDQPAIVRRVVEASVGKTRNTPVAKIMEAVDVRMHRAQPKKPLEQFTRSVQMVDVAARVLMENAALVADSPDRAQWIGTLTEARALITRTLKALEA